jgi:pimeloyl-ACP methyl ester carboxylesterase
MITIHDGQVLASVRDRWPNVARTLDYSGQLGRIHAPTLICVGHHEPQAPLACSTELARGIPGAGLVVFERNGHYPFIEERERFAAVVRAFLQEDGA